MSDTATIDLPTPDTSADDAGKPTLIKTFILDTNVLLHNSAALFLFADNHVVIPFAVIEELDTFKTNNDDNGRAAREVIRQLDRLRKQGKLSDGIEWNGHGGTVRVEFADEQTRPPMIQLNSPDNRIIAVAWKLQKQGHHAILVTKDINVRIRTDALDIPTEDFEAQKVNADRMYQGYEDLALPGDLIDQLYEEKMIEIEALAPHLTVEDSDGSTRQIELHANQFVHLRNKLDDSHTGLARRLADTDHLIPVTALRKPVHGIMARNVQQTMALELLLDDDIKLVALPQVGAENQITGRAKTPRHEKTPAKNPALKLPYRAPLPQTCAPQYHS